MRTPEKLYQFHVANLRAITRGFDDVRAAGRSAVARGDDVATKTHVCLATLLLGAWAETRLLKLIYEPKVFSPEDRAEILDANAFDRWCAVVEKAFRSHYKIPKAALQQPALKPTANSRLQSLNSVLRADIEPIVTMRNKLAHGQWEYPLNLALDDVAQEQMRTLKAENLLSLKQKMTVMDSVCGAIHDLAVSLPTFERDWDKHLGSVEQTRLNMRTRTYQKWVDNLRGKHQRGKSKSRSIADIDRAFASQEPAGQPGVQR